MFRPKLITKDGVIVGELPAAPPPPPPLHHACLYVQQNRMDFRDGDVEPLLVAIIAQTHFLSEDERLTIQEAFFWDVDIMDGKEFTLVTFPGHSDIDGCVQLLERIGCEVAVAEHSVLEVHRTMRDALTGNRVN